MYKEIMLQLKKLGINFYVLLFLAIYYIVEIIKIGNTPRNILGVTVCICSILGSVISGMIESHIIKKVIAVIEIILLIAFASVVIIF